MASRDDYETRSCKGDECPSLTRLALESFNSIFGKFKRSVMNVAGARGHERLFLKFSKLYPIIYQK